VLVRLSQPWRCPNRLTISLLTSPSKGILFRVTLAWNTSKLVDATGKRILRSRTAVSESTRSESGEKRQDVHSVSETDMPRGHLTHMS